jgi:DNA-binding NtrC family response regulator
MSLVSRVAERMGKQISKISQPAMDARKHYPWPGNIRELQNLVERAVILTKSDILQIPALPALVGVKQEPVTLEQSERAHILKALEETIGL